MPAPAAAPTPAPGAVSEPARQSACAGPRRFASSEPLGGAELRGAPVHPPRPSLLGEPLKAPSKRAAAGLARLGLETVGDLLEHLPSDSREARTVAGLTAGRAGDGDRRGALDPRAAGAAPGHATAGRSDRVRHERLDARDLLQPALAGRSLPAGDAAAAARQARRARRLRRLPPRACERGAGRLAAGAARRDRRAAGGIGRALPGGGGDHLHGDPHARAGGTRARSPSCPSSWPAARGPRRGCPIAPPRSPRCTSRADPATRRPDGGGWPSTTCCSRSSCSCAAAPSATRAGGRHRARRGADAERALARARAAVRPDR